MSLYSMTFQNRWFCLIHGSSSLLWNSYTSCSEAVNVFVPSLLPSGVPATLCARSALCAAQDHACNASSNKPDGGTAEAKAACADGSAGTATRKEVHARPQCTLIVLNFKLIEAGPLVVLILIPALQSEVCPKRARRKRRNDLISRLGPN